MSDAALLRSSGSMTLFTAVSRVTGFIRILVVAAVLGSTYLGNTYQSANTVPNLLFELIVAGVLQSAMVPTFVALLDRADKEDAERVAGSVLGLAGAAMAALAAVGMLTAPLVMRVLVSGVEDPSVRAAQVRLGSVFLLIFLPQVVFYVAGMVATSVLHANDRFVIPAAAPIVNNVVVIASYIAFSLIRGDRSPSLDLSGLETAVLAGGTTLGVVAFCAVPVVAVVRSGFSLRPRFDHRHPLVRRVGRLGAWAAVSLAMVQVLLGVVLVLANRIEGGVVAYQIGFTFFLLPHALIAIPLVTASFPALSRAVHAGDLDTFAELASRVIRLMAFFLLPATATAAALGQPLATIAVFGPRSDEGISMVAGAVVAFAPGLIGYGLVLFAGRAFAALGDTRTPALASVAMALIGAAVMVAAFSMVEGSARVAAVAAGHSAAYLVTGVGLMAVLAVRIGRPFSGLARPLLAASAGTLVAGGLMTGIERAVSSTARLGALALVVAAGGAGLAVYLGVQRMAGGLPLATITTALRPRVDHG